MMHWEVFSSERKRPVEESERAARALHRQAAELTTAGARLVEELAQARFAHPDLTRYRFLPVPADGGMQVVIWHTACGQTSRTAITVLDSEYGLTVASLVDWAAQHERTRHQVRIGSGKITHG